MSIRLMEHAWDLGLGAVETAVLVRLAWHADNDTAQAWPPINGPTGLCAKTGFKERAVQLALKALEKDGHITRHVRIGRGTLYIVHPRTSCTPAPDARVTEIDTPAGDAPRMECTPAPDAETPAPRAPKRSRTSKPKDADASSGSAQEQRGRRIDHDWQPTKDLPDDIRSVVDGWPHGRLDDALIEFRDFWFAEAGKRATKSDWHRTWWNRIRAIRDRDKRDERNGKRHHRADRPSAWAARPGTAGQEPVSLDD